MRIIWIITFIVALLTSCSGVKNLTKANVDVPAQYSNGEWNDSASIADMQWWKYYADTIL